MFYRLPGIVKLLKPKRCRSAECDVMFPPANSLQVVCSLPCAVALANQKKAKVYKAETRQMRKDFNLKDRSYQLKQAQIAFNSYILERDKAQPCISCGTQQPVLYQAGHYKSVGAHPELRFDESNCHKQCGMNCNNMLSGNIVNYRLGLVDRIGQEELDWLEGPHDSMKLLIEEIIEIKTIYKAKLKTLKNPEL